MKGYKGFTLIEVIVILAVIAILAAMAIPTALRIFQATAENTTRDEMDNIKRALIGDPRKLQSSFRSDFGFLGDIGCLPTVALGGLDRLLSQGTYPVWVPPDSTTQTGAGWKGPYITGTPGEDFKKDQWGNDYTYTPVAGACPLTATLASNGPDGQSGTGDDITISILAGETTATVRGRVKDISGGGLAGIPVEFYSPVNGTLTTVATTTGASGEYSFTSVPFGARAVRALPQSLLFLVPGSETAETFGGDPGRNVVFKIVNYSGTSITITTMTASWIPSTDRYDDLFINQTNVDQGVNNFDSGELVDITNTTIPLNANPSAAMRVFVDSADFPLADISLNRGTTATIELTFEGGDDMRGRTFTVVFNHTTGGPSTVVFTP